MIAAFKHMLGLVAAATALALAWPEPAKSQSPVDQTEHEQIARQLVRELSKTKVFDKPGIRVLVSTFWIVSEGAPKRCGLCTSFEESTARALEREVSGVVILRVKDLEPAVRKAGWFAEAMEDPTLHYQAGQMMGAEIVVQGTIRAKRKQLEIEAFANRLEDGKNLARHKVKWTWTNVLQRQIQAPAPPLPFPTLAALETKSSGPSVGPYIAGKDGVSQPECVRCPPPLMPPKYFPKSGAAVTLSAIITAQGQAIAIRPMSGAHKDIETLAIEAVRKWRFRPAEHDGRPVAVSIIIEVQFRLVQ